MSKFNDAYLKPVLENLKNNADFFVKKSDSAIGRINAESDSITKKAIAELSYKQNISTGYKHALTLFGVGILSVLLAWAASIIIYAFKEEPQAYQKFTMVEQRLSENNEKLSNLSNSISSETIARNRDLSMYSTELELLRKSVETNKQEIANKLSLIRDTLQNLELQKEVPEVNNYSGYSLQNFSLNEDSNLCYDNLSFKTECNDTVKFENGWTYSGTWRSGMPNGNGKIIFPGGAVLEATFKEGQPIKIANEPVEEKDLLKSITHFHSTDASKINKAFGDVVIGYKFETGADTAWQSAYCYLEVASGNNNLRLDLSGFQSFSSRLTERNYRASNLYNLKEFNAAKKLCKYKRTGFN